MTIRNQKTIEISDVIRPAQTHELTDAELSKVSGGVNFTNMLLPGIGDVRPNPVWAYYPFPDVPPPSDIIGPFVG
ncbi:hypothetical protein [Pseudomonas syringae]|uniref:hypothetical protein n=1 Tax=Pseudomonas syringae TaxID=317 RepID=UPI0009B14122|nr:hypothetical protein [Pseudomonas syringae]